MFSQNYEPAQNTKLSRQTASLNLKKIPANFGENDENNRNCSITVEAAGKVLTGKQVANVLAENYENESDLHVDPLRQREAKNEKEKGSKKSTAEKMKKEITLYELLSAIKKSKVAKKSTRRR